MNWFLTTKVVTHSGSFHPDEVCAVAVMQLLFAKRRAGKLKVVRSRDEKEIASADFVLDVGGLYDPAKHRFDHHQIGGAGERANRIPYASLGLVWKEFGAELCDSQEVADTIDREFVQPIDAIDNGIEILRPIFSDVFPYSFGNAVSAFLPSWKELRGSGHTTEAAFVQAVAVARQVLLREITRAKDELEGKKLVDSIYQASSEKQIIVFPESYPWGEVLAAHPEVLYAMYPQDTRWHVKAVRSNPHSFAVRKDFPESWAGKRGTELEAITGVKGALFCHNKRFLTVASSKEAALALAELALKA